MFRHLHSRYWILVAVAMIIMLYKCVFADKVHFYTFPRDKNERSILVLPNSFTLHDMREIIDVIAKRHQVVSAKQLRVLTIEANQENRLRVSVERLDIENGPTAYVLRKSARDNVWSIESSRFIID